MISICTTIKNRSRVIVDDQELLLFPRCVQSIVDSVDDEFPCELVVADWYSDDWPLDQWLSDAVGQIPLDVVQLEGAFSRGRGLNHAARRAQGTILLFLDSDMLISRKVLEHGASYVNSGKAFFPVVYSFKTPAHDSGWWRHTGYGNCMVHRKTLEAVGGWPERSCWGREDTEFFESVASHVEVAREEMPGFYHQWHPNDVEWKDRYAEISAEDAAEKATADELESIKIRLAVQRLRTLVPDNCSLILADQATFGEVRNVGRRIFPFTEHNGAYWGPPLGDGEAVSELLRLRKLGADLLVISWPAFWWLQFYSQFNEYLVSHFRRLHHDEEFVIFDLRPDDRTTA